MNKTYTPGPWKAIPIKGRLTWAVWQDIPRGPLGETPPLRICETSKANAHLIAAAPSLLAALEWCIADIEDTGIHASDEAYTAVAQAKGKQRKGSKP